LETKNIESIADNLVGSTEGNPVGLTQEFHYVITT